MSEISEESALAMRLRGGSEWTKGDLIALLCALAAILAIPGMPKLLHLDSSSRREPEPLTFVGRVTNENGAPIDNATVLSFQDRTTGQSVKTDTNGQFHFDLQIETKSLRLSVSAEGFRPQSVEANPYRTGPEEITLHPYPSAPAISPQRHEEERQPKTIIKRPSVPVAQPGRVSPTRSQLVENSTYNRQDGSHQLEIIGRVINSQTSGGIMNSIVRIDGRPELAFTDGNGGFKLPINVPRPEGEIQVSIGADGFNEYHTTASIGQNLEVALVPMAKVLNPTYCAKYDHGLRHFYWFYMYERDPSHRRADWYQESATTWNACNSNGTHNHYKVVEVHVNLDGDSGVICKTDSEPARLFIPDLDSVGSYPTNLRWQKSEVDPWTKLSDFHEVTKQSADR